MSRSHPLAEVFGFPVDNFAEDAERHRRDRLCPFNNKSPNCTKASVEHPIGVCSIYHGDDVVITCPIRFREQWQIASDAASFFFPSDAKWTALMEVRLHDRHGESAGNIDIVLLSYDHIGRILDYGLIECHMLDYEEDQLVPFEYYLFDSEFVAKIAPFVRFNRKVAIAVNAEIWSKLENLEPVASHEAQVAWIVYGLKSSGDVFRLRKEHVMYTEYLPTWFRETSVQIEDEAMIWQIFDKNMAYLPMK